MIWDSDRLTFDFSDEISGEEGEEMVDVEDVGDGDVQDDEEVLGADLQISPDNSPEQSDQEDNGSHYSDDENRGVLLTRSGFQQNSNQEDEEMIDENYDPTAFLLQGNFQFQNARTEEVQEDREMMDVEDQDVSQQIDDTNGECGFRKERYDLEPHFRMESSKLWFMESVPMVQSHC